MLGKSFLFPWSEVRESIFLHKNYLLFWSSSAHWCSYSSFALCGGWVMLYDLSPFPSEVIGCVSFVLMDISDVSTRCHNAAAGSGSSQQSQLGFFPHGHQCRRAESRPEVFLLVEFILCSLLTYSVLRLRMLSQKQHLGGGTWCRIIKNDWICKNHCCLYLQLLQDLTIIHQTLVLLLYWRVGSQIGCWCGHMTNWRKTSVNGSMWSSMLALLLFCDTESLELFLSKHNLGHPDRGRTALGGSLLWCRNLRVQTFISSIVSTRLLGQDYKLYTPSLHCRWPEAWATPTFPVEYRPIERVAFSPGSQDSKQGYPKKKVSQH